jgi:hypothetical protein
MPVGRRPRYSVGDTVNGVRLYNVRTGPIPVNVITYQAVCEGVRLQGVKDPRGTAGIIIIHLRGLAPKGDVASPDNRM